MTSRCPAVSTGEHKLIYFGHENGGDFYRCINALCGEVVFQPVDGDR